MKMIRFDDLALFVRTAALGSFSKEPIAGVTPIGEMLEINAMDQTPENPPEAYDALAKLHPVGRVGQVSDVVDGILFLESSPFITGEILHIDGGQIAGH